MPYSTTRLIISLFGLFSAFIPASAQETTRLWARPNVLKTNLLAPISVFYERALTRRFALRTSVRGWPFGSSTDENFVNATIEGKFYTANRSLLMAREHPTGFFFGPYLKARSLRYVNKIGTGLGNPTALDEIKVRSIGLGLSVGYMWVLKRGIVIELVHGQGLMPDAWTSFEHTMQYSTVTSDSGRDYHRLDFRTGFHLGYAF